MNRSLNRSPRPQTSGDLYGLLTASLLGLSVLALTFVGLSQASSEPTEVVKLSSTLSHAQVTADQRATVYLKVDLEGLTLPEQGERPPLNIALVIDRSGSMQGDRIRRAKEAAILAVERLGTQDIVSVIAYDTHAQVIVPATKASSKASIINKIRKIRPLNSTALYAGVKLGADETLKFISKERVNRVILLSDGIANVGPSSPSQLAELGRQLVSQGLSVSTIGLGLGYNEDLMSQLASASDGNHVFVESPEQLTSIMGMELGDALAAVVKDAELELTFAEGVRPVRALGREATFKGQRVTARLGTIGAKQSRYLLIEAELSPLKLEMRSSIAHVKARFYVPSRSASQEVSAAGPSVVAVESATAMRDSEVKSVMEEVLVLLATEKQKIAVSLKDRGDSEAAARVMNESAELLSQGATRYRSKKLSGLSASAKQDSKEIKKSGASWKRLRKGMKRKAHKAKTQQAY